MLLGWEVTIRNDGAWIRPPPKAINKIIFVFFCFDEKKGQPQSLWDIICGVAERYSNGLLSMRCYVAALQKMKGQASRSPSRLCTANSAARFDMEMWRVIGLLLWANPDSFSISIEMFTHRFDIMRTVSNRSIYTVTDASGWRICVALYDSATHALLAWSSYLFPFKFIPELYQNNREYLGVIMSLMIFRLQFPVVSKEKGVDLFLLKWIGDNTSALSWVEKEKCNSLEGQTVSMVFTWFQLYANIFVNEVEHLPGEKMGDIDHNSRDNEAPSLLPELFISLESIPEFASLIQLLDPSFTRNLQQHHTAFMQIHKLLSSLLDNNSR